MQCPTCGSAIAPGDAFCPKCGSDVRAITQAAPPPPPPGMFPGSSDAPSAGAESGGTSPGPPPFPGQQPAPPYGTPPSGSQPAAVPPATAQAPASAQPKRGLSAGAIAGIISAVIVGIVVLGVGGYFGVKTMLAPKSEPSGVIVAKPDPASIVSTSSLSDVATDSVEPSASALASPLVEAGESPEAQPAEIPEKTEPGVVTDAEARDVVKKFMDLRVARKINASKQYCTRKMLTGKNGQFINDVYWRPDKYKIKKTTPDLMYIHVAVMGMWPSGWEPTVYSVFRDPKSGKVLIDDMIDPETSPDLWK